MSVQKPHPRLTLTRTALACLLGFTSLLGIQSADAGDSQPMLYPFGMCSNGAVLRNNDYPVKMLDAGARIVRVDCGFIGARAKPGDNPDQWDWSEWDKVRALRAAHPDLQVLPQIGYGSVWAQDPKFALPNEGVNYTGMNAPPRGADLPVNDPKNLYGRYVFEAVKRNKDIVHDWESWNEPDLPGHGFFKGSGKDFFIYQKTFYLAAKMADPNCKVVFAGLCYGTAEGYLHLHKLVAPTPTPPSECFFEDFLKECVKDPDARKNNFYFDVMNQHSYSRASDMYDYIAINNKLMQDYLGEVKPSWVTEYGIPDQGGMFGCTPDGYCDYVLQAFAWGKLAGVERFFHFQLDNSNTLGLYGNNGFNDPKPALTTYRDVLVANFADAKFVAQLHGSKGVDFLAGNSPFDPKWKAGYNLFQFAGPDGSKRYIAFADTDQPQTVKVPAAKATATLIDRHNQRTQITAKDGFYEIHLQGATDLEGWPTLTNWPLAKALGKPEYLIGGATLVIVE